MNCAFCKGRGWCGQSCKILAQIKQFSPKVETNFSGASPPDIFVGRFNYPTINTGILAPTNHDESKALTLSSPEEWFKKRLSIEEILAKRGSLIYSTFKTNIKSKQNKLLHTMQELAMAQKPCSTAFILKKKPLVKIDLNSKSPPIGNPAPLKKAVLEENPKVPKKINYLVEDADLKAKNSIINLHKHDYSITSIIKLLSAGLLGLKKQRKLTPSRWATTAVDSILSENLIRKLKTFPWINDFQVFTGEYIGNHYEILLIPRQWSFEVIEAKLSGSCWNQKSQEAFLMHNYESFYPRKNYASQVAGAYYVNRLAITEYLTKIRRQASVLFLREAREEYWAPLGVGILREVSRAAFTKKPSKFKNMNDAIKNIKTRLKLPIEQFLVRSQLLKELSEQKTLFNF